MKQFVFLLLIVIFCQESSFAQQDSVRVFYDYDKCLSGFIHVNGDTIHGPKYKQVRLTELSKYVNKEQVWLVQEGTKFGLISLAGEILIPAAFDRLYYLKDHVFAVVEGDKMGVYDLENNQTLEPSYTLIRYSGDGLCYETYEGNKRGAMTLDFDVIFQPIYDRIDYLDDISDELLNIEKQLFYRVYLNGKVALLNENRDIVIPFEYNGLNLFNPSTDCRKILAYINASTEDGRRGILNLNGDTIVPFNTHTPFFKIGFSDDCSTVDHMLAITRDETGYIAYNLLSGKQSEKQDFISYEYGLMVHVSSKGTGFMDDSFQPIVSFPSGILARNYKYYMSAKRVVKKKDQRLLMDVNGLTDSDFMYHFDEASTKKSLKADHFELNRSLVNLKTKRQTGYHNSISLIRNAVDTFYWAIDLNGVSLKKLKEMDSKREVGLTVYSSDFNVLYTSSIKWASNQDLLLLNQPFKMSDTSLVILKNNTSKYGGITLDGTVAIPFEYSHFSRIDIPFFLGSNNTVSCAKLSKDGQVGLFSPSGKNILSCRYDNIRLGNDRVLAAKGDSTYYFDFNFRVKEIVVKPPKSNEALVEEEPYYENFSEISSFKSKYEVRQGYLFWVTGDTIATKVDSNFTSIQIVKSVGGKYLVSKTGKVILSRKHYLINAENGYYLSINNRLKYYSPNHSVLFDFGKARFARRVGDDDWIDVGKYKGIFDPKKNDWVLEPNFRMINLINNRRGEIPVLWATKSKHPIMGSHIDEVGVESWMLFDLDGNQLLNKLFNRKFSVPRNEMAIVASGIKFGVVDSDWKMIVPIEYDYIVKFTKGHRIYDEGKWMIHNGDTLSERYDFVSTHLFPNGYVVFNGDKMSILNNDLETVLPFSTREEVLSIDLMTTLGIETSFANAYFGIRAHVDRNDAELMYVNHMIYRLIYESSTKGMFYEERIASKKLHLDKGVLFNRYGHLLQDVKTSVVYQDSTYLSEIVKRSFGRQFCAVGPHGSVINYQTLTIEEGDVKVLALRDFILPGKEEALDLLIIQKLNETQAFGSQCIDLMGEVGELKLRYSLDPLGIRLHQVSGVISTILLPFYELEGIIEI